MNKGRNNPNLSPFGLVPWSIHFRTTDGMAHSWIRWYDADLTTAEVIDATQTTVHLSYPGGKVLSGVEITEPM